MEIWPKTCAILRFLNFHPQSASSTVRTSLKRVDGPIRRAESDGLVRLALRSLFLQLSPTTCPILKFFNLHPQSASSRVRTSVERVDTPIRCAESDGAFRLDISATVMELCPKTCAILPFFNLHPQSASSTVRRSVERVYTPIRCTESDGVVCLFVRALLTDICLKTCPILLFFNLHPQSASSTVRTSVERVHTPIRGAECDGIVSFGVRSLYEQLWRKTCPILGFF